MKITLKKGLVVHLSIVILITTSIIIPGCNVGTGKHGTSSTTLSSSSGLTHSSNIQGTSQETKPISPTLQSTGNETVLSQNVQSSVDNSDPANRMIKYVVDLTNVSGQTLSQFSVQEIPTFGDYGGWYSWTGGPASPGPVSLSPGVSLSYVITYGYDATKISPDIVADHIKKSGLYISYTINDEQQKVETIHFEVPDSIYSLSTSQPISINLTPEGEYRIEEPGVSSAGSRVSGEINGHKYLFVQVNTQNADKYAPPGILILNIDDPAKPTKTAYLQSPDNTQYLIYSFLSGTDLYVSADNYLWIIDVSKPSNPRELSRFSGINSLSSVINGKYVYICDGNQSIDTLDVSDPVHPHVIGSLPLSSLSGISFNIYENYLLAWAGDTLYTIDVSSPASLKIIHKYNFSLPGNSASSSTVTGSDPAYIMGEAIEGEYAFIALGNNSGTGMSVLDISDPTNPNEITFFSLNNRQITGPIFASTNRVYLFSRSSLSIDMKTRVSVIDVFSPSKPYELSSGTMPDWWSFINNSNRSSSSQSESFIDGDLYWFIGNPPNSPVIEIIDLSGS